jgi:xylitol oxidase
VAALRALRSLAGVIRPVLQVTELRTVAADRLWMSPQHGRDTLSVHFTWHKDWPAVRRALVEIEAALAPFGARPHWGKLFLASAEDLAPLYGRLGDFSALAGRLDPRGVFVNDWLRRHVLGG